MGGRESRTKEAEKRDEEQRAARADLIGRVGGSGREEGRGRGFVGAGAEKGSSLKARLKYSRSEPGFRLAQTEWLNPTGWGKAEYSHMPTDAVCSMRGITETKDGRQGSSCVCAVQLLRSVRP